MQSWYIMIYHKDFDSFKLLLLLLYERTYYEEVIKMCQTHIDAIDYLHEQKLKVANYET